MKNLVFVALISLYSALSLSAVGNDHGNGGGVICINKKCQTLADSGLSISPNYPDFWIPADEVLREIDFQIARYPFESVVRNRILQRALLKLTHFKAVTIVDPEKLEKIKNDYIQAIKDTSPDFDFSNFKIVAISSDDTTQEQNTYVLPEFLELSTVDQAKILIHEGLYRGRASTDLKYILQLESALQKYAITGESSRLAHQTAVTAQISAYHINILTKSEFLIHILATTFGEVGPGSFSAFLASGSFYEIFKVDDIGGESASIAVNADYVRKWASFDHRVAVILLNLNENIPLAKVYPRTTVKRDAVTCVEPYGFLYFYYGIGEYFILKNPDELNLLLPR